MTWIKSFTMMSIQPTFYNIPSQSDLNNLQKFFNPSPHKTRSVITEIGKVEVIENVGVGHVTLSSQSNMSFESDNFKTLV